MSWASLRTGGKRRSRRQLVLPRWRWRRLRLQRLRLQRLRLQRLRLQRLRQLERRQRRLVVGGAAALVAVGRVAGLSSAWR